MIRAHRLSIAWIWLSVCVLWPAATAIAETNPTPIAIPLTGTSGAASPYPSTIIVDPPGGATDTSGYFQVTLHAMTHPCLQDLAVLLVHNDTERYLLLSNAGGCRPLQGTEVTITGDAFTLPPVDPSTTPYNGALHCGPSNYGATPVFPEPVQPGPYTLRLPPFNSVQFQGTWSLFVMDVHDPNRGVIAGGWSLSYDAFVSRPMISATAVAIPSFGPAHPYPVTFDLTDIRSDVRVRNLTIELDIAHQFADDVQMVLQSPSGTAVVVMANAGGGFLNTRLIFTDEAGAFMPDGGPIRWRPTRRYNFTSTISFRLARCRQWSTRPPACHSPSSAR